MTQTVDHHGDIVLAFDIGTSSLRTALFDEYADVVPDTEARQSYTLETDADGGAELSATVILEAARDCARRTVEARGECNIVAVAASSLWHSFVGLDASGNAITPVYTWADSRGANAVAELKLTVDERDVHRRTGCMLHASFWPGRMIWLRKTHPELFDRVATWVSPAEYVYRALAGVAAAAPGMVTATGIYDPVGLKFDSQMLKLCGLDEGRLGTVDGGPQAPNPAALRANGLEALGSAQWYPAIGDGAASNLGSGGDRPGVAAVNLGTSGAIRLMESGSPSNVPYGLFAYRVDEQRYLVGGAVSNLASLIQWCWRELSMDDDIELFEAMLQDRQSPDHGLTVLPFWLNERAPRWRDDMSGGVLGIRQSTTKIDICQAIIESAYHRLALINDMLSETRNVERLVVSGGLAMSASGMQRLCNVLGRGIDVCSASDASIRGAAAYALSRRGVQITPPNVRWRLTPDAELTERFAQQRARQVEIERRLYDITL